MLDLMKRDYNFNSIWDLLDYRKSLEKEIKKYEKYVYFIPFASYIYYVKYCCHMLKLVNILIKNKWYK